MHTNGQSRNLRHTDYVAGWLDSSIPEFLDTLPPNPRSAAYALITCLDSNLIPKSLLKTNADSKLDGAKPLGKGLLCPLRLLHLPRFRELFFGFDEVWFFPSDQIEPKPESAWIVGPNRIDQSKVAKLAAWMSKNECSLGLGDGDGLNVIVKARGVVKHLIAHSLSQPEPTLQMTELVREDPPATSLAAARVSHHKGHKHHNE